MLDKTCQFKWNYYWGNKFGNEKFERHYEDISLIWIIGPYKMHVFSPMAMKFN